MEITENLKPGIMVLPLSKFLIRENPNYHQLRAEHMPGTRSPVPLQ